uniref:Uncharacterized protein n=1 Tax=Corethron hystrix TaxID=216773 RepID=A0A7S1BNY2_9STRA|mmetsp:Transcript_33228/g.76682  ORF Transcript_33228/g.76682 Transcript_33228/m.76682 type:complete len:126 (+) Transcript_33228:58-435(+)
MNYFTLYYYLNLSLIPVLSKGTPNKQNEKIEEGLKISSPFHSIDFCFDEPNFRYHDEELLDCAWISEKKDERCNFHYLGRSVSHFCRMTCDTCANKYICDDKNNNHSNREGCFCDWVAQSKKTIL